MAAERAACTGVSLMEVKSSSDIRLVASLLAQLPSHPPAMVRRPQ